MKLYFLLSEYFINPQGGAKTPIGVSSKNLKQRRKNQLFKKLFTQTPIDHLSVAEYKSQYFGKPKHFLLDVRSQREFAQGHVAKAVNIPLPELMSKLNKVPAGKPVIIICATGNRSQVAARKLVQSGRGNVFNLRGGTSAWVSAGHKITRK